MAAITPHVTFASKAARFYQDVPGKSRLLSPGDFNRWGNSFEWQCLWALGVATVQLG